MHMKTMKYLFYIAIASLLMAADCSNKDSEFYNEVYVSVPNLVTVERSLIPENQTIYINATIPKLLTVASLSKPLDIFKTTKGATKFIFSYELEKENADGTWDFIDFTSSNTATTTGLSQIGPSIMASLVLNSNTNNYEYASGIQGLSTGNYRLSFGYNNVSTSLIEFRSQSVDNYLFVNIDSPVTFLDSSGYYNFTVN